MKKGKVNSKMKIVSYTDTFLFSNLYDFFYFVEDLLNTVGNQTIWQFWLPLAFIVWTKKPWDIYQNVQPKKESHWGLYYSFLESILKSQSFVN